MFDRRRARRGCIARTLGFSSADSGSAGLSVALTGVTIATRVVRLACGARMNWPPRRIRSRFIPFSAPPFQITGSYGPSVTCFGKMNGVPSCRATPPSENGLGEGVSRRRHQNQQVGRASSPPPRARHRCWSWRSPRHTRTRTRAPRSPRIPLARSSPRATHSSAPSPARPSARRARRAPPRVGPSRESSSGHPPACPSPPPTPTCTTPSASPPTPRPRRFAAPTAISSPRFAPRPSPLPPARRRPVAGRPPVARRDARRFRSDPTRPDGHLTPIDAHRLPRRTTPIRAATPPPSPPFSARTTCSPTRRSARDTTRRARTRRRWRRNSWKISEGARFATEASRARFEPRPSRTPSSRRRRTRAHTPPGSRRGCARGCVDAAAARERKPPTVRNQSKNAFLSTLRYPRDTRD